MALTQSSQVLLVGRHDPQDPVRRVLKGAGYAVVAVDSPSSALRTAERSRPAVVVVEPGAVTGAVAESLAAFAVATETPLIREWLGPESLLAQVQQAIGSRESASREGSQITVGPLSVDLAGHQATVGGSRLDLTAREFDLLCHLARHPGWVYSRQELLEQVWGYEFGDPRVVTVHMANLRKKLDATSPGCELIETVRNVGYKLVVPTTTTSVAPEIGDGSRISGESVSAVVADMMPERTGETTLDSPAGSTPTEERRVVTVLYAHLGGLTEIAEALELRLVGALVSDLFDTLLSCVIKYDGRAERLGPDTLVALFGAPIAHDNDGEMALRAALEVRDAVAVFAAKNSLSSLSVNIGLNTGIGIAGSLGGAAADYSVMGEPVDGASRLAGIAGPGEILAGLETVRLTSGLFESDCTGSVKVRGRTDELLYESITGITPRGKSSRTGRGIESALVGRDEHMAVLRGYLDRLDEGVGGIVFVTGEAGMGKSRLVAEFRQEAARRQTKWLETRALPYGQNISYLPFREIVQEDCGIEPADSVAIKEAKLRERLGRLFADKAGEFLPLVGNLLGIAPAATGGYEPLLPEEQALRRTLFDIAARYVRRLSTERPTIFVFEDVHWLDRSSATLLQNLLPLNAEIPILACLVGRRHKDALTFELLETARETEGLLYSDIELRRLSFHQTRELIRNLLSGHEVDKAVMHAIETRSEGNPFFIEEIIRHLIDAAYLQRDERGKWAVAKAGSHVAIPMTIQAVITARIDRLPKEPRQELVRASVIGRSFYRGLLRELSSSSDEEFERSLESLQDHQLIFPRVSKAEREYAFKHALVQEAAYSTLPPKQRKQLHRRVAVAIEERYSGQIKDLYGILAYHYTRAEDWQNAQNFLLKAGDQSVSMAADEEAVAQYQEAMSALLRAFGERWDSAHSSDQIDWFVTATEPFWLARCLGDLLEPAESFYKTVLGMCGPDDPRTYAAATVLAGCYYQRGMYDQGSALLDPALTALQTSGREADPSAARLLMLLGLCRLNTDRFAEGQALFERALRLESAKEQPNQGVLQDLYIYLSSAYFYTGHYDKLRQVTEEALEKFDLQGTQRYWMLLINLIQSNMLEGRWEEAAEQAQLCVDSIPNPYMRATAATQLGEIRLAQQAYLDAEEHFVYADAVLEELGEPVRRFEVQKDLAETQLQAGKVDRAEQTARNVLKLMEATATDYSEAEVFWTLAGVALARGDCDDADRLLERCADIVREKYSSRHPFCAELCFRRAGLRLRQGRLQEAEDDFQRALGFVRDIGGPSHPRIGQMNIRWTELLAGQSDSENGVDTYSEVN